MNKFKLHFNCITFPQLHKAKLNMENDELNGRERPRDPFKSILNQLLDDIINAIRYGILEVHTLKTNRAKLQRPTTKINELEKQLINDLPTAVHYLNTPADLDELLMIAGATVSAVDLIQQLKSLTLDDINRIHAGTSRNVRRQESTTDDHWEGYGKAARRLRKTIKSDITFRL